MPPTAEEFARWREDFVTRWVLKACEIGAEDCKTRWTDLSWVNGAANQPILSELRTRADAYLGLVEASYEDWCDIHQEEPLRD